MKKTETAPAHLEKYYKAVDRNQESAEAHFRLGSALVQTGFMTRGEKALLRSLELDPDRAEAWVNLGGIRLSRWDFRGCIEANDRALNCEPSSKVAFHNKGLGHLYLGEAEEMVGCFSRVVELDPDNAAGNYYLAVGLYAVGREAEARKQLKRAVELGHSPDPKFVKEMEKTEGQDSGPVTILELGSKPEE
jgi:tetratricopeptide (TPR) repeat protein